MKNILIGKQPTIH